MILFCFTNQYFEYQTAFCEGQNRRWGTHSLQPTSILDPIRHCLALRQGEDFQKTCKTSGIYYRFMQMIFMVFTLVRKWTHNMRWNIIGFANKYYVVFTIKFACKIPKTLWVKPIIAKFMVFAHVLVVTWKFLGPLCVTFRTRAKTIKIIRKKLAVWKLFLRSYFQNRKRA